ncbi:unnamed protein product [Arabidopsis halleri]
MDLSSSSFTLSFAMGTSDVGCTCCYLKIFALMVPEASLPACAGAQCRDSMVLANGNKHLSLESLRLILVHN